MYRGVYTALVTPFTASKEIDENKMRELVEFQIASGIAGLVPIGTTGESPTLSPNEISNVIRIVVEQTAGRVPVIAGAGANCTEKAIRQAEVAEDLGADATLQVVPYYNKPSQEGLYEHFIAIANAVDIPMVLYDVPGRTGVALENHTILELTKHPRIVAVKAASGNIQGIMDLLAQVPQGFDILSGDDNLSFPIIALGGSGVISVASNLFPKEIVDMVDACLSFRWEEGRKLHYRMLPFFKALFLESNPIPIKAAMALKGLILDTYRLPLRRISPEHRLEIERVLTMLNISESREKIREKN